jgi:hypothetical protein
MGEEYRNVKKGKDLWIPRARRSGEGGLLLPPGAVSELGDYEPGFTLVRPLNRTEETLEANATQQASRGRERLCRRFELDAPVDSDTLCGSFGYVQL